MIGTARMIRGMLELVPAVGAFGGPSAMVVEKLGTVRSATALGATPGHMGIPSRLTLQIVRVSKRHDRNHLSCREQRFLKTMIRR